MVQKIKVNYKFKFSQKIVWETRKCEECYYQVSKPSSQLFPNYIRLQNENFNLKIVIFLNVRLILHLDIPSYYPILVKLKASKCASNVQLDWFPSHKQCLRC